MNTTEQSLENRSRYLVKFPFMFMINKSSCENIERRVKKYVNKTEH